MTAQYREEITIDGQIYGMKTEPLDPLIIKEFNGQKEGFPDGYPTLYPSSTACWRGYIGYWLIDDNQLWLKDVRGPNEEDGGKIYVEVAQDQLKLLDWRKTFFNYQKGNIKADWYSGQLIVEMGELIKYVHIKGDFRTMGGRYINHSFGQRNAVYRINCYSFLPNRSSSRRVADEKVCEPG